MGFAAKASRAPRPTAARARRRIARPVRASSSSPLHPGAGHVVGDLPSCVGWVRRLDRRGVAREFYVVGTVHTPGSASADEVRSVIERVKPNAVVLELDQERFDGVLATFMRDEDEDAMRRTRSSSPTPSSSSTTTSSTAGTFAPLSLPYALASSARGYGADFVAGAAAAEAIGALVVLGDAKARSLPDELRARMTDDPLDPRRLVRSLGYVARAFGSRGETRVLNTNPEANEKRDETLLEPRLVNDESARTVSFVAALAEDPGKLSPLAGPLALLALGAAAFARDLAIGGVHVDRGGVHAASAWLDLALSLVAAIATARAAEVLLEDRDGVLARSAARASACCDGVRTGSLRRVSYGFTADATATSSAAAAAGPGPAGTPCFTLRSPLAAGETRRLNLFEPRWLSLMDRLAAENGGELVGATLGCMLGVSRRYVSEDWLRRATGNGNGRGVDSSEGEGRRSLPGVSGVAGRRSADIVIEPWMRLARVIRCEEGARAVTGARKLEVWIEGLRDADPGGFFPRVASVTAHPAGYLCARTTTGRERDGGEEVAAVAEEIAAARVERGTSTERRTDEPVRVVCVVGLAHCNGVVDRLAAMDMERWR